MQAAVQVGQSEAGLPIRHHVTLWLPFVPHLLAQPEPEPHSPNLTIQTVVGPAGGEGEICHVPDQEGARPAQDPSLHLDRLLVRPKVQTPARHELGWME